MTIALGILASDGVVIAADREETFGQITKSSQNKISGVFRLSTTAGTSHRFLLLAGSGHAHYIDAFAQYLDEGVLADPRIDANPKMVLDQALERFYTKKVVPFSGYPSDDRPDFRVVMGLPAAGRSHLFLSDHSALREEERFSAIGLGSLVVTPLIKRLLEINSGARSVSIREAVVIAAHAVRDAKETVQGVGKETDIMAMFDDGALARMVPPTQDKLDAALKRSATTSNR